MWEEPVTDVGGVICVGGATRVGGACHQRGRSLPLASGGGRSSLAKAYITSQVMHTIHHHQPGCLWFVSGTHVCVCLCTHGACMYAHVHAGTEYSRRVVAVLAGVTFNWNTQRAL